MWCELKASSCQRHLFSKCFKRNICIISWYLLSGSTAKQKIPSKVEWWKKDWTKKRYSRYLSVRQVVFASTKKIGWCLNKFQHSHRTPNHAIFTLSLSLTCIFLALFFSFFSDWYLDFIHSFDCCGFYVLLHSAIGMYGYDFSEAVSNTLHINNIQFITQSFIFEFVDIFFFIATNTMDDTFHKRDRRQNGYIEIFKFEYEWLLVIHYHC